jgi:uncharacterized integral membrane protein
MVKFLYFGEKWAYPLIIDDLLCLYVGSLFIHQRVTRTGHRTTSWSMDINNKQCIPAV